MIPDFKTNMFSAEFGPAIRPEISIYLDHVNRRLTINYMYMFVYGQMVRWIGVFNMYLWPPAIPTQWLAILIIDGIASASPRPGVFMAMHFNRYYCGAWFGRDPGSPGSPGSAWSVQRIWSQVGAIWPTWSRRTGETRWALGDRVYPDKCENRFSESWQVIPILVKIRRLWIWSESRAQLLNHIHLIWISDIWSPLSLCFLCTRHNLRSFPAQSLLCSYGLTEENGQVWPDSIV